MVGKKKKLKDENDFDKSGYAQVHRAAFNGYFETVRRLIKEKATRLELRTLEEKRVTPLWLAFQEGHIETVDVLLLLQADITVTDKTSKNGIIDTAILMKRYALIKHLTECNLKLKQKIFHCLVESLSTERLNSEYGKSYLHATSEILYKISSNPSHVDDLNKANVLGKIIFLYPTEFIKNNSHIETRLTQIIHNLISMSETALNVGMCNVIMELLIERLSTANTDSHPIIIAILKLHSTNKSVVIYMTKKKLFRRLYQYLVKNLQTKETVLNLIEILRDSLQIYPSLQENLHNDTDLMNILIQLLKADSTETQEVALEAIKNYITENLANQKEAIESDLFLMIKDILIRSELKDLLQKACEVITSACYLNCTVQKYLIELELVEKLVPIQLRYKEDHINESVSSALWAIAGEQHQQTVFVTQQISMATIIESATSNSSTALQYYGSEMIQVVTRMSYKLDKQNIIISQLLDILKLNSTSVKMSVSALRSIRSLSVTGGFRPNMNNKTMIVEKQGLEIFAKIILNEKNENVLLETWRTVAIVTDSKSWKIMKSIINFTPRFLAMNLQTENFDIKSSILQTLTFFHLSHNKDIINVLKERKIPISTLRQLLKSENDIQRINAAYQMIVLNNFIKGDESSTIALEGINFLTYQLENNTCNNVISRTADLLSTVAEYCPGVKEALVSAGLIGKLSNQLMNNSDVIVRIAVSVTIVTLSSCLSGEIQILNLCRQNNSIFKNIEENRCNISFTDRFLRKWKHYRNLTKL